MRPPSWLTLKILGAQPSERQAPPGKGSAREAEGTFLAEEVEDRLHNLHRLYLTLIHTNQLIVRARDPDTLFREICRIAVEHGGMRLAWVGLLDPVSGGVRPVAQAGEGAGFLDPVRFDAEACQPAGKEPGIALRDGRVTTGVCGEAGAEGGSSSPDACPAAVSLPLRRGGRVIGCLNLYADRMDLFDSQGVELLGEMAADISFALDNLERDAQRRRVERELRTLSRAVESCGSVIFITDRRGVIEYVNPKFTEVTGFTPEQAIGRSARFLTARGPSRALYQEMWQAVNEGREWHGEVRNRTPDGGLGWCMLTIAPVRGEGGEVSHFVAVAEDISERKASQAAVERLAFYDPVTELPNRSLFSDRIAQAVTGARRSGERVAILFMDLDRFKEINDSLGHEAGDQLLRQVGERLRACVRPSDTVARLGGDEFGLLLTQLGASRDAAVVAEKILQAFTRPFRIHAQEVFSTASIGIAVFPADGTSCETLLKNADAAMYQAKEGRNMYRFFTPELNATAVRRLELEGAIRRGLERGEFQVHYQPQVELETGRVVGVEALARWRHPQRGLVPPAEFIPLAEETGLIVALGEFLLAQACRDACRWSERHPQGLRVAVNVSARQFCHGDILRAVGSALGASGLDPSQLELELTESVLMKDAERTVVSLRELKALGVGLSIDDFGTGYSSLSYLKRFSIDALKIDRSFVRDIAVDPDDAAIVTAIIAMARRLRLRVIAEGVEDEGQRRFLLENGCRHGQGFLYARPMPLEELLQYLDRHSSEGRSH